VSKIDFSGSLQTPKDCRKIFRRKVFFLPVFRFYSKLKKGLGLAALNERGRGCNFVICNSIAL
jgi:hypothetical protein